MRLGTPWFRCTEEGNFFALDAENGKPLWDIQLGGAVRGIPISFAIDGKQYVAISAGYALFVGRRRTEYDSLGADPRFASHEFAALP